MFDRPRPRMGPGRVFASQSLCQTKKLYNICVTLFGFGVQMQQETSNLPGGKPLSGSLAPFFPNLELVLRDTAHASRRLIEFSV